jgi:hypothetical protein
VPTRELTHLLWVLIRKPTEVAPILADADPEWLTDREEVLRAVVQIGNGVAFTSVVADLDERDPDVARTFRAIAAREGVIKEEDSVSVARDCVLKLEGRALESKIIGLNAAIGACEKSSDKSSYRSMLHTLSALNSRRQQINAAIGRTALPGRE